MNNEECKISSEIINVINSNETSFYSYSTKVSKYSGSYNNINEPYEKSCVPDVVESISRYLI